MTSPEDAAALAARLHAGQTDKAGRPYIEHLARVAAILTRRWPDATRDEIDAAWLHDSLEDTEATEASLLAAGMSRETIRIVRAVTRPEGSAYLAWIGELADSGDVSVLRVKLADNEDNRDPARVAALPGAAERVATRYEPARALLETGLAKVGSLRLSFGDAEERYEILLPGGRDSYEDSALTFMRGSACETWTIEVDSDDPEGRRLEGMTHDGRWFELLLAQSAVISFYGDRVLVGQDVAVGV